MKASRAYHTGIFHGIKIVTFWKDVHSTKTSRAPTSTEVETKPRTSEQLETLQE